MRLGMEKNAHGSIFQIGATSTGFIIAEEMGGHMPHIDYFYRIS